MQKEQTARPPTPTTQSSPPDLFARSVSLFRPLSCLSSSARAPTLDQSARSAQALAQTPWAQQQAPKGQFLLLLHSTASSFVLSVCVSVHQEPFQSQPPSPPPPSPSPSPSPSLPPRHPAHIIPHHRSFCHYSRASTIKSYPTACLDAAAHTRLNSPSSTTTTTTTTPHASTSSPVSLSSPAPDSTLVFIKRTSFTSQHHRRARTRAELALPARATRLQRHT